MVTAIYQTTCQITTAAEDVIRRHTIGAIFEAAKVYSTDSINPDVIDALCDGDPETAKAVENEITENDCQHWKAGHIIGQFDNLVANCHEESYGGRDDLILSTDATAIEKTIANASYPDFFQTLGELLDKLERSEAAGYARECAHRLQVIRLF